MIDFVIEEISFIENGSYKTLRLPKLTKEEKFLIDPIIAPTSGLRIKILDQFGERDENRLILTTRKLFLFLRVFKAISKQYKEMKKGKNLKIFIGTDDRPTNNILLQYCSQIFAYEGYEIYHQEDIPGESKISSPYGAASVALLKEINLIIILTASHNDLSWNGIKFYIDDPMPMSGDLFKEISNKALNIKKI
ncbi:MAG: hypothetical protein ACFE8G_07010, partial [Candidatus Hermodarchaeota archaeon]